MKTIGIDLGTTNSCVYYLDDNGNPVLVRDSRERGIFPSAVWSAGAAKERIVGHQAKARMGHQPAPVIAAKRKMGTDERVLLGGVPVGAVEVSVEILRYAKRLVEEATGDKVGAVVVTVPAYFDAAPKRDTQLAALAAFFDNDEAAARGRLELLLEPEAAAYAYVAEDRAEEQTLLVYDLGGGTFDITLLEKTPEMGLSVLKFGGDPHLGGDNFDDRLALWILYLLRGGKPNALEKILSGLYDEDICYTVLQQVMSNDVDGLRGVLRPEHRELLIPNPPRFDLDLDVSNPEDLVRIQKLKLLAENAKKQLTTETEVVIVLQSAFTDHSGEMVDIEVALSRKDFNLLCGDMIKRTISETVSVVRASGISSEAITRVLLVGGSSRMPVVSEELKKIFSCPVALTDPDFIVARGGAIRARTLKPADPAGEGALTLDYPRQTGDRRVNIVGRLATPAPGGQAYLTDADGTEMHAQVDDDRFLLRAVELREDRANVFRVEVFDGDENPVAEADIQILHNASGNDFDKPQKITKPIRYLAKNGFRVLFPEGEPLPATKEEICYRASKDSYISIPIYEGERFLRDLRIEGINASVNVGTEIELRITIAKDYNITASAMIVATRQKADIQFQIERVKMPTVAEMEKDKKRILEEIEDSLPTVSNRNDRAEFSRQVRRVQGEFTKASKANEPDLHHLFSLVGELKKLQSQISSSLTFMKPPEDEFKAMIRVCRNLIDRLPDNAAVDPAALSKKVASLEAAGKDAWAAENQAEWSRITRETAELVQSLKSAVAPPSSPPEDLPPGEIQRQALEWLDELAETADKKGFLGKVETDIESTRSQVRSVDIGNEDSAVKKLMDIVRKEITPLDKRIKALALEGDGPGDDGKVEAQRAH